MKFAGRAGDEYPSTYGALSVFHTLYDAGRLAAFGAVCTLRGVHDLLAVSSLGDLCHVFLITPKKVMSPFYAIPALTLPPPLRIKVARRNWEWSERIPEKKTRMIHLQISISDSQVEAALHLEEALPRLRAH